METKFSHPTPMSSFAGKGWMLETSQIENNAEMGTQLIVGQTAIQHLVRGWQAFQCAWKRRDCTRASGGALPATLGQRGGVVERAGGLESECFWAQTSCLGHWACC